MHAVTAIARRPSLPTSAGAARTAPETAGSAVVALAATTLTGMTITTGTTSTEVRTGVFP